MIPLKIIPVDVRLKAPITNPKPAITRTIQFSQPNNGINPMSIPKAAINPSILLIAFNL